MQAFWLHAECPKAFKFRIWDAVVKAKLVYGLESLQINDDMARRLDAFHLRGLRQIMKIPTTFIDRANTNSVVFEKANQILCAQSKADPAEVTKIVPLSIAIGRRARTLLGHILRDTDQDPLRQASF